MASFGTGIARESVFVAELEKEFQSRLMTISCSQNSLNNSDITTVEKWLQGIGMGDYTGLFMNNGFDDVNFLVCIYQTLEKKKYSLPYFPFYYLEEVFLKYSRIMKRNEKK